MSTQTLLVIALFGVLLSAGLFWIFVRPVPSHTSSGVILDKTYEDERTLTRSRAGPRREIWTANRMKIPAGYLFTIQLNDGEGEVYYLMERVASKAFDVGQAVTVIYEERGIPPFWTKRYVRRVAPADSR